MESRNSSTTATSDGSLSQNLLSLSTSMAPIKLSQNLLPSSASSAPTNPSQSLLSLLTSTSPINLSQNLLPLSASTASTNPSQNPLSLSTSTTPTNPSQNLLSSSASTAPTNQDKPTSNATSTAQNQNFSPTTSDAAAALLAQKCCQRGCKDATTVLVKCGVAECNRYVYRKWNEKFFRECYKAYLDGRAESDPSLNWYKGEIGFFDFYIIPLARKLKKCGVFGVSSDEYLNYALQNRQEWEDRGREVVEEMINSITSTTERRSSELVASNEPTATTAVTDTDDVHDDDSFENEPVNI